VRFANTSVLEYYQRILKKKVEIQEELEPEMREVA
jgi:hypothetical protein